MSGILVPFVKQIVGYFVFQTEVLHGLPLGHRLRFVTDEQMLKITAAIHVYRVFDYSSEGRDFYALGQDVKIGRLPLIFYLFTFFRKKQIDSSFFFSNIEFILFQLKFIKFKIHPEFS